ncbi:MAG TPA: CerR family C-terminal domain-containing protein, partial [Nannocystaceae bacterium]|nr:CerR family C-terminal domain-containing protein [Nannocystaceae bacterium]
DAAGVNLAAVNYHFGGKEGLYQATLEMLVRRTREELPGEAAEVRRLPPEEQLRIFTRVAVGRLLEGAQSSAMSRILAHEMLDPTPAFDGLLRDVAGPRFDRLTDIVARLLGPAANADEVALASFSVIGQWAFYLYGRAALEREHAHLLRGAAAIDRLARRIADDMRAEPPQRLRSIWHELRTLSTREFWEVIDRGSNFDYLTPDQKAQLATFFGWFEGIDAPSDESLLTRVK